MSRFFLIVLIFSISSILYGQKRNTDYHLKHNIKQEKEQYEFTVLDFDANGVYNYDKEKFYYWLKAQKVHATQGYSSGLLLHGEFQAFYTNKQLSKRGYFQKGLKNGEWLYWNEQGVLVQIEFWRSGVKAGTEKIFDSEGILISKTKYKGSKIEKITKDSTIVTNQRKNTQKIVVFDQNHQKSKIVRLKNNTLHGKQESFKDGKSEKAVYFENGKAIEKKPFLSIFKKDKATDKDSNKKSDSSKNNSKKEGKKWKLFSKDKKTSKKS